MAAPDATERVAAARGGSVRALARLVTVVENGGAAAEEVAAALTGVRRTAHVIGITGAPGAGKSTLTAALLRHVRATGATVAVLAVDPSSPLSGGALLGDRVRMGEFATDRGVFIRSFSARGRLGGISTGTPAAVDLLSALGFDIVVIETVGVGQSEVDIMDLADTVAVVMVPGMGDDVQAAKAGILEIADLIVVNKADRPGAKATLRELRAALGPASGTSRVPVLATVAETGEGVDAFAAALADHHRHLADSGALAERAHRRARSMVSALVTERVRRELAGGAGRAAVADAATRVIQGDTDAYRAADTVWRALPRD